MYSLQTRMKALAIAGMMAASVAGGAVTAFATPAHTLMSDGVPVVKTVQVADGITLPEKEMEFAATFATSTVKDGNGNATGPSIEHLEIEFAEGSTGTDLSKEGNIALKSEFGSAVPGEYVYTLKETTTSDTAEYGWKCDQTEYVLRVYVDSNHNVKYTVVKSDSNDEKNTALDNDSKDSKKLDKASFSNIYTKRGGSEDSNKASLVINKEVKGNYGDLNQYFTFKVKFDTPDTYIGEKTVTATFSEGNEYTVADDGVETTKSKGDEKFTLTKNYEYTFYLKNGGSVSFDDLPAGTYYTLTETGVDGYKAKIDGKVNGKEKAIATEGTEGGGVVGSNILIGEHENTATVINTYSKTITITGVVTHSAPFVIMVGALFVAVGGYVVLKKKIEE